MVQSKLLDVAIREFGRKGLEGASTRGIAAAAGTAMSSITYHYSGKDGLYTAVARHVDRHMAEHMATVLPDEPAPADPALARQEIHRLLDRLAVNFIGCVGAEGEAEGGSDDDLSLFIMREQMHPTAAFDLFYRGTMGRTSERLSALVRSATGAPEAEARIAAMTLFGQVQVWRTARALADRLVDQPVDAAVRGLILRQIARNTDCILDRMAAAQGESP